MQRITLNREATSRFGRASRASILSAFVSMPISLRRSSRNYLFNGDVERERPEALELERDRAFIGLFEVLC